ncbi:sigma intracellular receptor 2 isoform X1 [Dicentrarchus labrax]|uniref:sigma intracellular receptor 2 isoform X1 n=1 Tax=Dicentrarchus labrax TaxID=13489 RepID=UPI0021F636C8|nr:sigma intracellular receptor 2 isoform X1 [Dicentrarchus labrax]
MAIRVLEIIFFFYFASHIPITLFIDLQALLPQHVYPQPVSVSTRRGWKQRYNTTSYKGPITCFVAVIDLNFPQMRDFVKWYAEEFKDPLMMDPPDWFRSFIFCEALFQLPFFPVAAYAFLKGGCKWIRTPAIVYSAHVATTLVPILSRILFYQFPMEPHPGPQTPQERWLLVSIYVPYLLVPLLLLFTMLLSPTYNSTSNTSAKAKKKKN